MNLQHPRVREFSLKLGINPDTGDVCVPDGEDTLDAHHKRICSAAFRTLLQLVNAEEELRLLRSSAQKVCDEVGGALSYGIGRTWGEGQTYWTGRFEEAAASVSDLRRQLQSDGQPLGDPDVDLES